MTLTTTSVDDLDSAPPRFRVDIASTPTGLLPVPDNSLVTVYRVHEDGTRYEVLTEPHVRLIAGAATVFDYHAPYGVLVSYVAVAATHESAESTPLFLESEAHWLIHPTDPTNLSVSPDHVATLGSSTLPSRTGVFQVFGSPYPVTRGNRRLGKASSLMVRVPPENIDAIEDLFADGSATLINLMPGYDVSWCWVQADAPTIDVGKHSREPYRDVQFNYVPVGVPNVDVTQAWTCADVLADESLPTCADVLIEFDTCDGFTTNTRGL